MSRRLDWEKAKSDKLKGMTFVPADPDMTAEPEHQEWWGNKTGTDRATSKESVSRQMAEAFARGRPEGVERPKEVVAALISPKIKALLAEAAAAVKRRREQFESRIGQASRRPKARGKKAKKKG